MLDEALVALGGEEGVGDGGVGAEGFGGEEGVDLAGDALVAEGAGGRLFEGGRGGSLEKLGICLVFIGWDQVWAYHLVGNRRVVRLVEGKIWMLDKFYKKSTLHEWVSPASTLM